MLPILRGLASLIQYDDEPSSTTSIIKRYLILLIAAYNGKSETRKAIDHYSYALNEEIGRGFSSKVYKGRDEHTQNPVAVKVHHCHVYI
jgi:serine/threonine protein kinase